MNKDTGELLSYKEARSQFVECYDGYTHRYAIVGRTSNLFKAIGKAIRV